MQETSRIAAVTGASQGIGRAIALELALQGYRLALMARNEEKLGLVAGELREKGATAEIFACDVADSASIQSAFAAVFKVFSKVDILVNNAGITRDQLMLRMKPGDWDAVLQTNLTSAFLCSQQVIPGMMKQRWGRIINITSIVGQTGNPGQANYVASKAGLIGFTRALALEIASRQITVNAVAPGFIQTAMTAELPPEAASKLMERIPLRRMGTDQEIAAAVRFLSSEEAGYITGQTLNVNGGLYLG